MGGQQDDRDAESRRILDRISRETEGGAGMLSRGVHRARDHLAAKDADKGDWAEYWGTRIGRLLGLALTIGLLAWLVLFLMRG
jgi:hypothetical protein